MSGYVIPVVLLKKHLDRFFIFGYTFIWMFKTMQVAKN